MIPSDAETEVAPEDLTLVRLLPPELRAFVRDLLERRTYAFGDPIVREGEAAEAWYGILSGRARVLKRGEHGDELPLALLHPGDSFGERALIDGGASSTTVRASDRVVVARLDAAVFRSLVTTHPELADSLRAQARFHEFHALLAAHPGLARLPPPAQLRLLGAAELVDLPAGRRLFAEGDPPGPMYVVDAGRLRATVTHPEGARARAYFQRGDLVGERSLLLDTPRETTVEALSDARLLVVSPAAYRHLLDTEPAFRAEVEQRVAAMRFERDAAVPPGFREENVPAEVRTVPPLPEEAEPPPDADGPFADPAGRFVKRGRIRRFPIVLQIDEMDCGAASLAMVCRHFGRRVSLTRLRELLHTGTDGTRLSAIVRAAEHLGLAARSVKASPSRLDDLPLPAIVHWQGGHWMVLYRVERDTVHAADPASGSRRIPRADFLRDWSGYAALFDFEEAFAGAPEARPSLAWVTRLLRPHTSSLLAVVGLAAVVAGLEMVLPVFTQVIVDRVLVDRDADLLHLLLGGLLAVFAFLTLAVGVQRYLLAFVAVRVDASSLDFLARRLLALPIAYFATRRTGDIQRRLAGLRALRDFAVSRGLGLVTAAGQLAAALLVMAFYSPWLAAVFLATVPVYLLLMRYSSWRLRPLYADLEEAFAAYASRQIDAIKGIETVKAMGAEGRLRRALLEDFLRLAGKQFAADLTVTTFQGALDAVAFLSGTGFLLAAAHEVLAGRLTIGGLVAFNALVAMANVPMLVLVGTWDELQQAQVLLDRLADIFESRPELPEDRSALRPVTRLDGHVELRNVGFRFGGPESTAILHDVSFEVQPGTTVAIVGRSGSGKTTLVKCLAGLLTPTEGAVLFDGQDLRTLDLRELRRHVGFVLQENFLFHDTITRTIAFADDEPDLERVMWAARVANAHGFIELLPQGYETRVGEGGVRLSGGQQQRLAIARAVYARPSILVLDEATSALDTESERAIQANLAELLRGRTAFVIAHRMSTIRDADRIVVLEKGRVAEVGDHDALLARKGLYYYLCSQQLGL